MSIPEYPLLVRLFIEVLRESGFTEQPGAFGLQSREYVIEKVPSHIRGRHEYLFKFSTGVLSFASESGKLLSLL